MAGKNKREAIDNFAHYFRESLSCICNATLLAVQESDNLYKLFYENPADLECDDEMYLFSVIQVCSAMVDEKRGGYKARTKNYSYTLIRMADHEEEVLSYHWHPDESDVRGPHLHVGCIPRVHFPTSRVCLEDVIHMLIKYYGIKPLLAHSKWTAILEKNSRAFDRMATWK